MSQFEILLNGQTVFSVRAWDAEQNRIILRSDNLQEGGGFVTTQTNSHDVRGNSLFKYSGKSRLSAVFIAKNTPQTALARVCKGNKGSELRGGGELSRRK